MLLSAFVTIVAGLAHGVMLLHLHSVQRYDSKYVDSLGWFFGHRRHCRHSPYMCMYLYMRKLKKGKKSCSALGLSRCDALTRTYLPCVLCPANGRLHYRACALILLWGGSCAFGFYRNGCVCCRVQHKGHFVYQLGNFLDCTHLYLWLGFVRRFCLNSTGMGPSPNIFLPWHIYSSILPFACPLLQIKVHPPPPSSQKKKTKRPMSLEIAKTNRKCPCNCYRNKKIVLAF